MKINKYSKQAKLLVASGLLLLTFSLLLRQYFLLPDLLEGFLMGTGLGLEVIGLIKLKYNFNPKNIH